MSGSCSRPESRLQPRSAGRVRGQHLFALSRWPHHRGIVTPPTAWISGIGRRGRGAHLIARSLRGRKAALVAQLPTGAARNQPAPTAAHAAGTSPIADSERVPSTASDRVLHFIGILLLNLTTVRGPGAPFVPLASLPTATLAALQGTHMAARKAIENIPENSAQRAAPVRGRSHPGLVKLSLTHMFLGSVALSERESDAEYGETTNWARWRPRVSCRGHGPLEGSLMKFREPSARRG